MLRLATIRGMAKQAQQVAALLQALLRLTGGRLSGPALLLILALAVGYVFARPLLESTLGVSLPAPGVPTAAPEYTENQGNAQPAADDEAAIASAVSELRDIGRGVYETPVGLRYTRGSQHGHRLKHLMAHTRDQPDRPGQHGVFDTEDPAAVVGLIDEAYEQALSDPRTEVRHEGGRTVYEVDLGRRVGYIGGESGNRRGKPAASHLRMVIQGKNVITAFPVRP